MLSSFDQFSIIIGGLIGIIVAILLIKFLPVFIKKISTRKHSPKTKNDPKSFEQVIRKHELHKVQSLHLASDLCPLSEIYIAQRLYGHPLHVDVNTLREEEPIFFQEALSIADVPELAGEFPLPKFKLSSIVTKGKNVAISGEIGSGKTTCMANLAIEVLEGKCENPDLNDFLPVYVHFLQIIPLKQYSLIEIISRILFDEGIELTPPEIIEILSGYQERGKLLVLLDGLDEFRSNEFDNAVTLLRQLRKDFPNVILITTCGSYYTRGLTNAGFSILPIVPPGRNEQLELLAALNRVYRLTLPANDEQQSESSASILTDLWMSQEIIAPTYSDITLFILSILSRDIVPHKSPVVPYLNRKSAGKVDADLLIRLAEKIIESDQAAIPYHIALRILSAESGTLVLNTEEIIDSLIDRQILSRFDDKIRFTNPSILCNLIIQSNHWHPVIEIETLLHSPIDNAITLASGQKRDYLLNWINNLAPGNVRALSLILNHILSSSGLIPDISATFPKLAQYIVSENLPLSTKIKLSTIIYYANPDIFLKFLNKLASIPRDDSQKICAFYYGLSDIGNHLQFIFDMIECNDDSIRTFGILSLLISTDTKAPQYLLQLLSGNPEKNGRLLAELSSQYPENGRKILNELAKVENADIRRFVIYGLRLVSDDWADEILLNISRDDSVWIVRDAAAQAIQNRYDFSKFAPIKLPPVFDHPIIISAASRRGTGIPPNKYPYDLLFDLLENGKFNESVLALQYLIANLNESSIQKIKHLTTVNNPLREMAVRALFEISLRF